MYFRHTFRYSLRTSFVVLSIICVCFVLLSKRANYLRARQDALSFLLARGATISDDNGVNILSHHLESPLLNIKLLELFGLKSTRIDTIAFQLFGKTHFIGIDNDPDEDPIARSHRHRLYVEGLKSGDYRFLTCFKELRKLDLGLCSPSDDDICELLKLQSLESLTFIPSVKIDNGLDRIESMRHLRELQFRFVNISPDTIENLSINLKETRLIVLVWFMTNSNGLQSGISRCEICPAPLAEQRVVRVTAFTQEHEKVRYSDSVPVDCIAEYIETCCRDVQ